MVEDINPGPAGSSPSEITPVGGTLSLVLERPEGDGQMRLVISDSGIGIPPEDLPQLFERFHRARNVSEFSGNGLGLAIVKAIVAAHGGTVQVRSDGLGLGSTFVVNLPVNGG